MKVQNGWANVPPVNNGILSLKKLLPKMTEWVNPVGKKILTIKKSKRFRFMKLSVVKKKNRYTGYRTQPGIRRRNCNRQFNSGGG